MTEQQLINALFSLYVTEGNAGKLISFFETGFRPDLAVDLITLAAGIGTTGDGRDAVLSVLLRYPII